MRAVRRLLLILLPLGAIGCAPIIGQGQSAASDDPGLALRAGTTVGQTFVARHAGLQVIELFLRPREPGEGMIRLRLRSAPDSTSDLAAAVLRLDAVDQPGFYRFELAPQPASSRAYYYAQLEVQGTGGVAAAVGPADSYLHGAAYQNGEPAEAQLVFRLGYSPLHAVAGLGREAISWLAILGVGTLLFVVPGLGLLATVFRRNDFPGWLFLVALSPGLSLALYPILMLWTDLIGLRLGAIYGWIPPILGAALLLRVWRRPAQPPRMRQAFRGWRRSDSFGPDLTLIAVTGLVFAVRFYVIRALEVPMWGDSYQHTMITQLLVDNAGLFDSWAPYAELETFTYHFGFHAGAAAIEWISGADSPTAVLWAGQIFNGLAVVALYPLGVRLGGNRWAGVAAVLIAGLLSPMPMYYVNWGRYTQLAGLVILPAAMYLSWPVLTRSKPKWSLIALTTVAFSGLALSHYRVFILGAVFLPAVMTFRPRAGEFGLALKRLLMLASGTAIVFLPWLIHTFTGRMARSFIAQATTMPEETPTWVRLYNKIGEVAVYVPVWLLVLTALSVAWGLWRRKADISIVALWFLIVLLVTNPQWLNLPGEGVISNFAVLIMAYVPASLSVGAAVGWTFGALPPSRIPRSIVGALMLLVALLGARQRLGDLDEAGHTLVTRPDQQAMQWIRQNTPGNARFLVSSFLAFGDTTAVGSDAGWWIPLLTGRQNSVPPINYALERGPHPTYATRVNQLTRDIQSMLIDQPEVVSVLEQEGLTHLYIGQRQGRVNYNGPQVLDPELILGSTDFQLLYQIDRVYVFELVGGKQTDR